MLTLQETLKIAVSRRQITRVHLALKNFWCELLPNGFQIRKVHEKTSLRFTGFIIWTCLPPFFFRFRFHFFLHSRELQNEVKIQGKIDLFAIFLPPDCFDVSNGLVHDVNCLPWSSGLEFTSKKNIFSRQFHHFLLPKSIFEALLQPLPKRSSEYHFHKIELFFIFLLYKSTETSYDPESYLNRFLWCFYTVLRPKKAFNCFPINAPFFELNIVQCTKS